MDFPDVFAERLETYTPLIFRKDKIYTHPKAAAAFLVGLKIKMSVSTHSRPKVAAPLSLYVLPQFVFKHTATRRWLPKRLSAKNLSSSFNTQPPEGGCLAKRMTKSQDVKVSTHSHPKVAAKGLLIRRQAEKVSTHSHPKVAAPYLKKQEKSAD